MKSLKSRSAVVVTLLFLVAMTVLVIFHQPDSRAAYSPFNRHRDGTMALAELLKKSDINISPLSSLEDLDSVGDDVTVVVVQSSHLNEEQSKHLALATNVVFLGTQWADLSKVTDSVQTSGVSASNASDLPARCDWAPALRAESVSGSLTSLQLTENSRDNGNHSSSIDACFPLNQGDTPTYATVHVTTADGRNLTFIADGHIAMNENLASSGHASLLINVLGQRPHIVWFDASMPPATSAWNSVTVPPFLPRLLFAFLLTLVMLAVAMGRRFGPLIKEPLPVDVKAVETTIGLGRLYEHSHDREHACAYLRSGTLHRMTKRLSSSSSLSNDDAVMLIASHTHRHPHEVHAMFFGPAPTTDRGLVELAKELDTIESEVHPL